jgi:hypothetical protein
VDLWRKLLRDARHRLDKALHIGVSVLGPGGGLAILLSHVCPTLDPVAAGLVGPHFVDAPPAIREASVAELRGLRGAVVSVVLRCGGGLHKSGLVLSSTVPLFETGGLI